jgi:hypothetical protein
LLEELLEDDLAIGLAASGDFVVSHAVPVLAARDAKGGRTRIDVDPGSPAG